MTSLTRLADDVAVVVRGDDAVVLRDGAELLRVPGAGPAARWLAGSSSAAWDLRWRSAAPPSVQHLLAVLTAHRVVVADPLTGHLLDLHAQTVGGHLDSTPTPDADTGFLAREAGTGPVVRLPPPRPGATPLAQALRERRSARIFGRGSVPLGVLGTILGAAAGTTDRVSPADLTWPVGPARCHPSGGALYPVETHVVAMRVAELPPATYRYLPLAHALSRRGTAPSATELARWLPDLPAGDTAAVVLLCVDFARPSLRRYGGKAYRLALLEAGHIAQNLLLTSTVLHVAGRPLAGYDDEAIAVAANLAYPTEAVVYAVGLGVAAAPAPESTARPVEDPGPGRKES